MIKNEVSKPSVNLFPVLAMSMLTLLGVIAALVMLVGLHNKVPKADAAAPASIAVSEIGNIKLDKDMVRINLMKRTAGGKVDKLQEITIPLEKFAAGFQQQENFMEQMIEKGIITRQ
ncbi:hypothetical protein [Mariniblastus fucicola]|uniref:Uncharacterized protein n=1 Tax=Mariniblastus fucicola TaxID=980251 RepID=A0A5B9PD19_9BACT|nr:hypothetical protein [Mariniblastus fucicola]QEG24194.1 hypothetical protein MFFC18_41110 [Mariniblastus fucicola]